VRGLGRSDAEKRHAPAEKRHAPAEKRHAPADSAASNLGIST
jgi:hypothetical protein